MHRRGVESGCTSSKPSIALLAAAACLAAAGAGGVGARTPSPARAVERFLRLGSPIYCGGLRTHYVALTFDDGPGPYTRLALRILRRAHAEATFFVVGKELRRWPGALAQEARVAAIGDHSWSHPDLLFLSNVAVAEELGSTLATVDRDTHVRVRLFRPPYGATDARIARDAARLGLLEVIWSVDTRDSEGANFAQIAANVRRFVRGGSIVLMHENRGQTIEALKFGILPYLRAHRFVAVTVPQLLALDPPTRAQLRDGETGCG